MRELESRDFAASALGAAAATGVKTLSCPGPLLHDTWTVPDDWPNRDHGRYVVTRRVRWYVQEFGAGPTVLMLHGTGSSTHSWRDLAPLLARRCRVIAPDLPGHGASVVGDRSELSLAGMVTSIVELLSVLDCKVDLLVGHSAGAAIAARLVLDRAVGARGIVALNGALLPFGGLAAHLLSPVTRLLATGDWLAQGFARRARDPQVVDRLLASTGSRIDAQGRAWYRRLACDPRHVAAALSMMARWDLRRLAAELPRLAVPLDLVVGSRDAMIPPIQAERIAARVARSSVTGLIGLGHLAHEEDPARVASIIERDASTWGVLDDTHVSEQRT